MRLIKKFQRGGSGDSIQVNNKAILNFKTPQEYIDYKMMIPNIDTNFQLYWHTLPENLQLPQGQYEPLKYWISIGKPRTYKDAIDRSMFDWDLEDAGYIVPLTQHQIDSVNSVRSTPNKRIQK